MSLIDIEEIKKACMDYVEGYYESNRERIEEGVHPELVKRSCRDNRLSENMTREHLVEVAVNKERAKPAIVVEVHDVYKGIAAAKITSGFVDYCHLGKIDGEWQVVNVFWSN